MTTTRKLDIGTPSPEVVEALTEYRASLEAFWAARLAAKFANYELWNCCYSPEVVDALTEYRASLKALWASWLAAKFANYELDSTGDQINDEA